MSWVESPTISGWLPVAEPLQLPPLAALEWCCVLSTTIFYPFSGCYYHWRGHRLQLKVADFSFQVFILQNGTKQQWRHHHSTDFCNIQLYLTGNILSNISAYLEIPLTVPLISITQNTEQLWLLFNVMRTVIESNRLLSDCYSLQFICE